MSNLWRRSLLLLSLIVLISGAGIGCSKKDETAADGRGENPGYRLEGFSILRDEEYAPQVVFVGEYGDGYVAAIIGHSNNALNGDNRSVARLAGDGTLLSYCETDILGAHSYTTYDDRMLCLGHDALYEIDPDTGSSAVIKTCEDAVAVSGFDGGYALLYEGRIEIYNDEDALTHTISDPAATDYPSFANPLFDSGDDLFLVTGNWESGYTYYSIYDDDERIVKLAETSNSDITNNGCYGKYVMTEDAVYLVHPDTETLELLLVWNNTDELPPSVYGYREDYPVSEDAVVSVYTQAGESVEFQIYRYDPDVDESASDRTVLVVGGYAAEYDEYLKRAVYLYNNSQDDYKVVIESYEYDNSDITEDDAGVAEYMRLFASGEAPDLICENNFDYDYMGRNGMVIDLSTYLDDFGVDENLINAADGPVYCAYPGYLIGGYLGRSDDPDIDPDMTYSQMFALGDNETGVCAQVPAVSFADGIFIYSMDEIVRNKTGDSLLSLSQFEDIIQICTDYGLPSGRAAALTSLQDIALGRYKLINCGIPGPVQYATMCYEAGGILINAGYPSVYGASHPVVPANPVAISAGTSYPDACADFISFLYSDEVQLYVVSNGLIPASASFKDLMIDCWAAGGRSDDGEDIGTRLAELFASPDGQIPDSEIVSGYTAALESADCVLMYNYDLMILIDDEISSYYTLDKPVDEIADSLSSRLSLYATEYYG